MAKAKTKAAEDGVVEAPEKQSASVLDANGAHIRTYSLEDHGADFAALAQEFSDHTPGSSVV